MDIENIHHEMKKITVRLMQRVLYIKEEKSLKLTHWVSFCEHDYKNKLVYFRFDPFMKPYLLKLKSHFTVINLKKVTQFKSIYSIRIYQLLCQYRNIGSRYFRVEELREILGLKENQYKEYKDFKKWIINQAKKEFEERDESGKCKSDISFELETIREGRKIAILKFIIIPTENNEEKPVVDNEQEILDDIEHQEAVLLEESAKLDEKIFNEFLEYSKENDKVVYKFYLKHGRAPFVQGVFLEFLDKREKEQKAQQG
jgi:plasmid replication initiation protein